MLKQETALLLYRRINFLLKRPLELAWSNLFCVGSCLLDEHQQLSVSDSSLGGACNSSLWQCRLAKLMYDKRMSESPLRLKLISGGRRPRRGDNGQ